MSDDPTTRILAAVELLGGNLDLLRGEVGELRGEFGELRNQVDGLRSEVGGLRGEVGGLRGEVGGLRGEVDGLRGEVGQFGGKVEQLRSEVGRLRGDMMARMDRLQDGFNALRDDGTVNFARTDRVESITRGSADEVRAMGVELSGMHRQIQRLQSDVRSLRGEP